MTEDRHKILDNMVHLGKSFETKLSEELPIVYLYSKNDEWNAVAGIQMYRSLTKDLSLTPTGMSRFQYLDKNRDKIQEDIVTQIQKDKGKSTTFILTTRPRVEAATDFYGLYLHGMWVKKKNLKTLQAPEEFEDPFPAG